MLPPSHIARTPEQIISEDIHFDSAGYLYRAMSWIDHFENNDQFPSLLYACIEARQGIEYLIFEEIIISTGADLSTEEYENFLKTPTKLYNALKRISPDYERLQGFTKIIVSLEPRLPKIIYWQPKKLLKAWGTISNYLHWSGSKIHTTEVKQWRLEAGSKVRNAVEPIWVNISSGQSAIMHPNDMHPEIKELWEQYKNKSITSENVKNRMEILRPLMQSKYA